MYYDTKARYITRKWSIRNTLVNEFTNDSLNYLLYKITLRITGITTNYSRVFDYKGEMQIADISINIPQFNTSHKSVRHVANFFFAMIYYAVTNYDIVTKLQFCCFSLRSTAFTCEDTHVRGVMHRVCGSWRLRDGHRVRRHLYFLSLNAFYPRCWVLGCKGWIVKLWTLYFLIMQFISFMKFINKRLYVLAGIYKILIYHFLYLTFINN